MPISIEIAENRASQKWSRKALLGRILWECLGRWVFALSPRQIWGWRCAILRAFGATIGKNVHIYPSVSIAIPWNLNIGEDVAVGDKAILYNLGMVTIGARSTVSQYTHLCAGSHDYMSSKFDLQKPPIAIGQEVWLCADSFVGPGVSIGDGSIVGARSVVVRDVPNHVVIAGNPSRIVKKRPATIK